MGKIQITNFDGVYEPAEDSWLMAKHIPEFEGSVLEVGCGTGIISLHLAQRGNLVTAVDINPKAVEATKFNSKENDLEIEVLEGDIFSSVKNRTFGTIVCNPPYLPPADEYDDLELSLAVEGGPTGTEFTMKLLNEAENHLEATGSVYMILSSRMKEFKTSWNKEIIKQEKYFFERLNLVRFSR